MKKWFYRTFKVISKEQAIEWNLFHFYNVYGDLINKLNCRSIWVDNKGKKYRVRELIK